MKKRYVHYDGEFYDNGTVMANDKVACLLKHQDDKIKGLEKQVRRLQRHLDHEMEEHSEKTFEMLEFMKEKGVFDEWYKRLGLEE